LENRGYRKASKARRGSSVALITLGALAAAAAYVQWSSRRAERENPPTGKFLTVGGTRLHYLDTGGTGPAILLLHGNGSMARELEISGIIGALDKEYRVIAFDRPGFGYSERPRRVLWTPAAQADLIHAGLRRIGIQQAIVLGHSWGNMVALELALRQPGFVKALVLAGGFYFPELRADVALLSVPAIPILGDIMRYTLSPLLARAIAPLVIRRIFKPKPVSKRFTDQFPIALVMRPLTLRAAAEENAMMIPAAANLKKRYSDIHQPTAIIAGLGDRIVDAHKHSVPLHKAISHSKLIVQPGEGHMLLYGIEDLIKGVVDDVSAGLPAISAKKPKNAQTRQAALATAKDPK
jgi:pimeloyl-ACP methyl ester carboxylesterase